MKLEGNNKKLEYLLEMVEKGKGISLSQISKQFGVSKRTAKRMIAGLRDKGYEIKYCKELVKFFINDKEG